MAKSGVGFKRPGRFIQIGERQIGPDYPPLVIAEVGINHEGSLAKAKRMIKDAYEVGAECVKFQCHIIEDEMVFAARNVIPGNATESIWNIMERCAFNEEQDRELKVYTESLGMLYLSTPFSRAAANRLQRMNVLAYKIGSGECNNYPLVKHIAKFGKPVILSTGMNNIASIEKSVKILEDCGVPYAIMHCTSIYPTPYAKVRLGALADIQEHFPGTIIGLSDHSLGNFTCFGAVALGASILEKHFTSDKNWSGPDVPISINPQELQNLIIGSRAIYEALGGSKDILREEQSTIDFAYATVVTIMDITAGEIFTPDNIWVKRPGTGEIGAEEYEGLLGRRAATNISKDVQLERAHIA